MRRACWANGPTPAPEAGRICGIATSSSLAETAYDEYFHTADFRRGVDQVGWHNIPRLGVFLWRLISFGVDQTTPVPMTGCPDQYSFDPTGREIPLFAAAARTTSASYGENWVSPQEWQLPGLISTPLLQATLSDPETIPLYSQIAPDGVTAVTNSLGIFQKPGVVYVLLDIADFFDATSNRYTVFPEIGRFHVQNPPARQQLYVTYHYGFASTIGAGPYGIAAFPASDRHAAFADFQLSGRCCRDRASTGGHNHAERFAHLYQRERRYEHRQQCRAGRGDEAACLPDASACSQRQRMDPDRQ